MQRSCSRSLAAGRDYIVSTSITAGRSNAPLPQRPGDLGGDDLLISERAQPYIPAGERTNDDGPRNSLVVHSSSLHSRWVR